MKKTLIPTVIMLCALSSVHAQNSDWVASNVAVANQHVVPKYQAVSVAANELVRSVNSICNSESATLNEQVINDYKALFLAWAQIQHVKFGPISFLKRYERFHYWPDKHNVGSRQLQRLIVSLEEGTLDTTALNISSKSVSLQGLSALERLFFSKQQDLTETQCFLSVEISKNLLEIANEVDQSWRIEPVEFAKEFELADKEQGTYGSSLEVATMLANTLATQLLLIAEYKLGQALPKKEGGRVYQRELEAWQSELSLDIIEQSLISLKELYAIAFSAQTKAINPALDKKIEEQFTRVIDLCQGFDEALIKTIVQAQELSKVKDLQTAVMQLESVIRSELFAELGFATQFNSLDGD